MTCAFQLTLPGFEGPVAALPAFLAADTAALGTLPLAEIPTQYLRQKAGAESLDLQEAGEVLATAARLLLLKSALLLAMPGEEEEPDIPIAAERAHSAAARLAAEQLGVRQGRESVPAAGRLDAVARRREARPTALLGRAWQSIAAREMGTPALRAAVPGFVRLEVAISRLLGGLTAGRPLALRDALRGARRRDAVMLFLATLEMARRGQVNVSQRDLFGDVLLESPHSAQIRGARAG